MLIVWRRQCAEIGWEQLPVGAEPGHRPKADSFREGGDRFTLAGGSGDFAGKCRGRDVHCVWH